MIIYSECLMLSKQDVEEVHIQNGVQESATPRSCSEHFFLLDAGSSHDASVISMLRIEIHD